MKVKDETETKLSKRVVIGFVVLVAAVVLLVLLPRVIPASLGGNSEAREDDGMSEVDDGSEDDETAISLEYENEYQLKYSVGEKTAKRILAQINRIVSGDEEYDGEIITASLNETTFRKVNFDGGYAYYFELEVSDGREYQAYVVTDTLYGNGYYGCLVRRVEPMSGVAQLELVVMAEDDNYVSRADAVELVSDWARGVMPGVKIVMNVND